MLRNTGRKAAGDIFPAALDLFERFGFQLIPHKRLAHPLYIFGFQQVEGNLLMPWVQRWAVELPPVLGITAAVIFGLLFGLPGIVLATPMMVVVMVLVQRLYVEELLETEPADAAARP